MAGMRGTFTNADLSNGVLTITHGLGLEDPYQVLIAVFDNNKQLVNFADEVHGYDNYATVDFTSIQAVNDGGAISGTWGWVIYG